MKRQSFAVLFLFAMAALPNPARAVGIFNTPRFIQPGTSAFGLEPEIILSHGAGLGVNGRFTHGLTELNNVSAIVGVGSGPRNFRIGGNATFDVFPDVEGQPGIGIAAQGIYYRLRGDVGQLETTAIPYIHKAFKMSGGEEVEPFFAFPVGLAFASSDVEGIASAAVGVMYKNRPNFRYIAEVGISVSNMESYISGGIVYSQ